MLLSTFTLIAGLGLVSSKAIPATPAPTTGVGDAACVNQTLYCYHSGESTSQERVDKAVEGMCKKYAGENVAGTVGNYLDFWPNIEEDKPISMQIGRPGHAQPGCDYVIKYEDCKRWLPKSFTDCSTHQGGNVTDDSPCGLQWALDPDVRELQDDKGATTNQTLCKDQPQPDEEVDLTAIKEVDFSGTSNEYGTVHSSAQTDMTDQMGKWIHAGCEASGFSWKRNDMITGATSFCNWADRQVVTAGNSLTFTFHYCLNGVDHKQLYRIERGNGSEPLCVRPAMCLIETQSVIDNCDTVGDVVKHGGWRLSDSGTYLLVDGDPDLHNPGLAEEALDCNDAKAVQAHKDALMAMHAVIGKRSIDIDTCG